MGTANSVDVEISFHAVRHGLLVLFMMPVDSLVTKKIWCATVMLPSFVVSY